MKLAMACAVLLTLAPVCNAQDAAARIAPNGLTHLAARIGGNKVEAVFRTSTVAVSGDEKRFPQCTGSVTPCRLTESLGLTANARDVIVPRSAFADPGDMGSAELGARNGRMILTIRGGDASEAYIAELVFDRQRIVERRVYAGEDPLHPLEVSHYFLVSIGD